MRPWGKLPPVAAIIIIIVAFIAGVTGLVANIYNPSLKQCSLFSQSPLVTLTFLVVIAASGWVMAARQAIPRLLDLVLNTPGLPKAVDADMAQMLSSAQSIQVFVSKSDRLRTFLTTNRKNLPRGLIIQVLVRDDGTPERAALIALEAGKWRGDVAMAGVTVDVRTYNFDPIMFRGMIFDRTSAVLGWYFNGNPLRQGHDLDMYKVTDGDVVELVAVAFDDLFSRGAKL